MENLRNAMIGIVVFCFVIAGISVIIKQECNCAVAKIEADKFTKGD